MKKTKSKDVDLLYILEDDPKDKNKKKKLKGKNKSKDKTKGKNKSKIKNKKEATKEDNSFDFDDEIVIGISKNEETKKENRKKSKKKTKKNKINNTRISNETNEKKPKTKKHKMAKYVFLFIIIIGAIIAFMMSPVFDVKKINVIGNSKLTVDEVKSLSGIEIGKNAFMMSMGKAQRNIKENPYVEDVIVSRSLPSEINIEVTERVATYMIEFVNGFVYINNQGYMLEISDQKIQAPMISGVNTPIEEFEAGNRLNKDDLQKLETVLKIMETMNSYGLAELISEINIADKSNYIIQMESEGKTVYLGNASNLNKRIELLKEIVEKEKGIQSEVFINKDINKYNVYTREKI